MAHVVQQVTHRPGQGGDGAHDEGAEELSEPLGSRVEVGEVFLDSSVSTAALQVGVVLGKDRDVEPYVGTPPGGNQTFADAVAAANEGTDTRPWQTTLSAVGAAAVLPPRGPVP